MDRIGPAGGSPTIALSNGQLGFVDENLAAGQEGTLVPAAFMNALQEELMSLVSAGGLVPNIGVFNQILTALGVLFGNGGSYGTFGWQKLAGGLILQWGTLTLPTGNNDAVVFPVAFPNRCWVAVACEGEVGGWGSGPYPTLYGTSPSPTPKTSTLISCVRFTAAGVPSFQGNTATYIALGN